MHRHHGALLDLVRVAEPAEPLVSLDELKLSLRVDHDDDNDLIESLGDSITASLDGFAGTLGRALVSQSWQLSLPGFPGRHFWPAAAPLFASAYHRHPRRIRLPLPPLVSVTSIDYLDPDLATQTLAADQYILLDGPLASIEPAPGLCWPSTGCHPRAVQITYVAGYGPPAAVPGPIRTAHKLMVGDLYENRASIVIDASRVTLIESPTVARLLKPYRVPRT
jgi:uncharacterized phiE125 gp8 family phage protein